MIKDIVAYFLKQFPAEDEQYIVLDDDENRRWALLAKYAPEDVLIATIPYGDVTRVMLHDCGGALPEHIKTVVRKVIFEIAKQFGGNYV